MRHTAGANRRRPKEPITSQPAPPPTPLDNNYYSHHHQHHRQYGRDSDSSFTSSRPSSTGIGRSSSTIIDLYKDRRYQDSVVSTINPYLSSLSSTPPFLSLPYPSAKDITLTLSLLMNHLEFPPSKLEDDLPLLLKILNYPSIPNKSILKSPGTPHQWPSFLAIIHWLTQIAMSNDHLSSSSLFGTTSFVDHNPMDAYLMNAYLCFLSGNDDEEAEQDRAFGQKMKEQRDGLVETIKALEQSAKEIGMKLEAEKSGPSMKEKLKEEKSLLEQDVAKFHEVIEKIKEKIAEVERDLVGKEKELEEKVGNRNRICEENEELKKTVELQNFNSRDVERMKREMQAIERDINSADNARKTLEEQCWDLDAMLGQKFKEIEKLAMDCNQAIRRLKLSETFQYVLNAKGSTPAEVMGIDYKSTIKPALHSFAEDIKTNSMVKLEDLIALQQRSSESASKIEGKRRCIAELQSHINEVEAQMNSLKEEMYDFTQRCAADSSKMMEDVNMEAHNVDIVEREAAEFLENSQLKLQEAMKQSEEEIQACACDLIGLVNSVSKYKEHVQYKILEMKKDVSETAESISDAYKTILPSTA